MTLPLTAAATVLLLTLAAPYVDVPRPLTPLQALWVVALAAALVPALRGARRRVAIWRVLWLVPLTTMPVLGLAYWYWATGNARWQTTAVTALAFSQVAHALGTGPLSSVRLVSAAAIAVAAHLALVYVPWLQGLLATVPLVAVDLRNCAFVSLTVFAAAAAETWVRRRAW